jgi:hypothetical protein
MFDSTPCGGTGNNNHGESRHTIKEGHTFTDVVSLSVEPKELDGVVHLSVLSANKECEGELASLGHVHCISMYCDALRCIAMYFDVSMCFDVFRCVSMCFDVLRCVSMYCDVLRCIAMCFDVFRYISIYFDVFRCVSMYCDVV